MEKQVSFLFILMIFLSLSLFSQDSNKENSYLLFELGLVYPELEFIDSKAEQSLNSEAVNIASNRIAIGGGGDLISRLGYLATVSSNRYAVQTYYYERPSFTGINGVAPEIKRFVHYNFDYAALDLNLTFRLLDMKSKWSPLLKAGASYNFLISGFQEMEDLTINLKENEDYTDEHIDLNFGFHVARKLSRHSHFWLGYNYLLGFQQQENLSNQLYNINAHSARIGFSISPDAFKKKDDDLKRILKKCNDNIDDLRAELLLLLEQDADTAADEFKQFVTPDENENSPLRDEIRAYVNTLFPSDSLSDINDSDNKTVILFPTNKYEYYEIFQDDLDDLIAELQQNPTNSIKIVGYADLRGKEDNNLTLSKNRAKTIMNYLIDNGVNPKIMSYDFRGATTKFDDIVLMSNRRVEIFISN
ncbi:MAG: OmpA family protein [Flavobacteriales bacterium]